ncbi:odorant receptor 131-2-like [Dunckerocampus dactyliophorus]|uniref:odorant receptor 131-2-like n=1 Tax=Dunckerocampus dactyliophorus TaxID=161453 RepID=UPI0024054F42|nr:odorant receptor 131-2-like [Dunckerocampus dactyliophorus]
MTTDAVVMNASSGVNQVTFRMSPVKVLLSMLPCLLFLYINGVMLVTLLRKPHMLESSRYVLFGHLLLSDSLQLLTTMLLYIFAVTMVTMISYVCMLVVQLAAIAVKLSPLNLAVMSLERYVAICFPLRHANIVTIRTTRIAIVVMWSMASLDSFIQLLLFVRLENTSFIVSQYCSRNNVWRLKIYNTIDTIFIILYFVVVSIIIFYTYIAIICAVRSASTNVQNANKARKTVMLHMFQLCLCLTSTLFNMINSGGLLYVKADMALHFQYALFLGLLIVPKCLSPLIYGFRDNTFRHAFKYYFTFGCKRNVQHSA